MKRDYFWMLARIAVMGVFASWAWPNNFWAVVVVGFTYVRVEEIDLRICRFARSLVLSRAAAELKAKGVIQGCNK